MNIRLFVAKVYHDFITREKRFKKWSIYDRNQWLDHRDLTLIQNNKLNDILEYSVLNIPAFKNLKIRLTGNPVEDIKLFPITDKKFYRDRKEGSLSIEKDAIPYHESSTSGSSGEAFFFKLDEDRLSHAFAVKYRTDSYAGILPSDSRASLWGASFDNSENKGLLSKLRNFLTPFTFLSSYDLSHEKLRDYVDLLERRKPKLLISYSSPLMQFAQYCDEKKIDLPYLKAIISSSEQLFDFQNEYIQKVFKIKVFNRYGTREFGSIAQECEEQNGLHVNVERVFIEVLNENNEPCEVGEKGQLVITDLDNKIMPLIRYKVGDFAAWHEDLNCECGRGLKKLKYIEGRSFDIIKTPSGKKISGTFWTLLLRFVSKEISSFQVIQNSLEEIEIKIVHPKNELFENELDVLYSKIYKEDKSLKVSIVFVDKIELTKSGKRKFIISNI